MQDKVIYFTKTIEPNTVETYAVNLRSQKAIRVEHKEGKYNIFNNVNSSITAIPYDAIQISKAEFLQRLRLANQSNVNHAVMGLE